MARDVLGCGSAVVLVLLTVNPVDIADIVDDPRVKVIADIVMADVVMAYI